MSTVLEFVAEGEPSLKIAVGRALGTVVVTLRGDFGPVDVERVSAVLRDLTTAQGNLAVAVDLGGLSSMEPATAATFTAASIWAQGHGGTFALCDPRPGVARTLAAADLGQLIVYHFGSGARVW